jgi:phospholipid/cholesterol/gamma-HCH transport system permease protein
MPVGREQVAQRVAPAAIAAAPRGGLRERITALGFAVEAGVHHSGRMARLVGRILLYTLRGRVSGREILVQMQWMGIHSIPIVVLSAILSGAVTAQQAGYLMNVALPLYVLGNVVVSSVVLELGPLLTAIVLIARVGARITAEYGTMQVSEQVDALYTLGRDPVRVLAAPRVIAGVLVLPLLVGIANAVGILAGAITTNVAYGLGFDAFLYGAQLWWMNWNLVYSLSKAMAFGFVISLIAVYMGFQARGGAEGVGRTTTTAVVLMLVAVLFFNALFPALLLD